MYGNSFGRKMMFSLLCSMAVVLRANAGLYYSVCSSPPGTSTHTYRSRDVNGQYDVSLRSITKGKLTLIVNLATFCAYTTQYPQLNALLNHFSSSIFSVVGFPCNQFGHQEPGDNGTEILNGLHYVRPGRGFQPHPNFHLMLKTDVNGPREHPLFTYLKVSCPQPSNAYFQPRENFWQPIKYNDITWNFEKFIVSAKGVPLYRFQPMVQPFDLENVMNALIAPAKQQTIQAIHLRVLLNDLDKSVHKREKAPLPRHF